MQEGYPGDLGCSLAGGWRRAYSRPALGSFGNVHPVMWLVNAKLRGNRLPSNMPGMQHTMLTVSTGGRHPGNYDHQGFANDFEEGWKTNDRFSETLHSQGDQDREAGYKHGCNAVRTDCQRTLC
ncbi:hypothetical protein FA15DRAFT_138616 [Coprinopsis marcescibilis]|uniref:Uncharacterized protein n=1 Tax=Coprinopsis marcescibilis TaxID=230819 RepID=A0A5C3KJG0_COPMA|nr:hypothetical protein FA15DRAFT_138616 [Coprinopsis marcescibilis]